MCIFSYAENSDMIGRSVHHFCPERNVLIIQCGADLDVALRMNCNNCGDPLTLHHQVQHFGFIPAELMTFPAASAAHAVNAVS